MQLRDPSIYRHFQMAPISAFMALLALLVLNFGEAASQAANEMNEIPVDELEPKVIGGRDAKDGEFPWMVALHYNGNFVCSSFLISPRLLMTAAHCLILNKGAEPASAFYGIIGNVAREGPKTKITFSEAIAHPQYGNGSEYDIAIFRIAEPVQMSRNVQAVCLPTSGRRFDLHKAQAMGWGVSKRGTRSPADTLQTAFLPVSALAVCQLIYSPLLITVTDRHVCAGGLTSGICFGDSGGPLVNLSGAKPVAIGVASFVSFLGCARPFVPAVYTATSSYNDWLAQTVRDTSDICFV